MINYKFISFTAVQIYALSYIHLYIRLSCFEVICFAKRIFKIRFVPSATLFPTSCMHRLRSPPLCFNSLNYIFSYFFWGFCNFRNRTFNLRLVRVKHNTQSQLWVCFLSGAFPEERGKCCGQWTIHNVLNDVVQYEQYNCTNWFCSNGRRDMGAFSSSG